MKRLPLYDGRTAPLALVERTQQVDRDTLAAMGIHGRACSRCEPGGVGLRAQLRNPCLPAEGEPGGLLVVGESPTREEDALGRPLSGAGGALVRKLIAQHWHGPVAFDLAVRCNPGQQGVREKFVDACRGYLAATVAEVRPTRVLALGGWAAYGLLGRSVSPFSTRRAVGWLANEGSPVPVFVALQPSAGLQNRFLRRWVEDDVAWALTASPHAAPWAVDARIVETREDAIAARDELLGAAWVAFDVETAGRMWSPEFRVISVAVCADGDDSPWVWVGDAMREPALLDALRDVLTARDLPKAGQNVKYDQLAMRAAFGWQVRPIALDTRLQRKLVEPEADGSLAAMSELVGMGGLKEEAGDAMAAAVSRVKRALKKPSPVGLPLVEGLDLEPHVDQALRAGASVDDYRFWLMPEDTLARYNARDAVATARLGIALGEEIKREPDLARTWSTIVRPAAVALERIEAWGVPVSRDAIVAFDDYLGVKEVEAQAVLDSYGEVNWNSPMQVASLLFEKLKLPVIRTGDSGKPSTDSDTLEALAKKHPLPRALLDYRKVVKLRGTYARGMLEHVRADRIHPNIKLDGARSGRTSCTDPNLQNIPRAQSVEGKMARDCFAAPKGYTLLECDYSQLELRIAAALSGDPEMRAIFDAGVDYHLRTAQLVSQTAWGIAPEQVEDKHRSQAKSFNFGLLYGQGDSALAGNIGCTVAQASRIREAILGRFKVLDRWIKDQLAYAMKHGHAWTQWEGKRARRRPLWRIADPDDAGASVARNSAHNTPIQGTASDFCIASLTECVRWIEGDAIDGVRLVLPIHDALLFEVREDMLAETYAKVMQVMQGWDSSGVPLVADAKVGPSWGSMEKYPPKSAEARKS